jgi:ribosomal protein S27AE
MVSRAELYSSEKCKIGEILNKNRTCSLCPQGKFFFLHLVMFSMILMEI